MSLTTAQLAEFETNGYLVLKDVLPPATVAALLAETHRLLAEFSLDGHPLTRFTTAASARNKKKKSPTTTAAADEDDNDDDDNDDVEHVGDDYFLTSGDKIRFFFEEDAFDPSSSRLTKPKERAINKIGHCLHALSPPFRALLSPAHAYGGVASEHAPPALARALGFADPRCLQSMVICKQPEIGGAVPPHQDSTFLYTDPPSAVGFWYALEDATLENGCLSFLPGSHKWAPITIRLVRKPGASGTHMVPNTGTQFPSSSSSSSPSPPAEAYVPAEVSAGSLVLIHGNLLHKSERNLSQKGRIIYTFHVIEGAAGTAYDERNWLQPPEGGFTRVYAEE